MRADDAQVQTQLHMLCAFYWQLKTDESSWWAPSPQLQEDRDFLQPLNSLSWGFLQHEMANSASPIL